ncbi:MAG: endonuclease [Prevotellaceae bacterium]|nr:endonuclease [Prevotellaceae bacterium]
MQNYERERYRIVSYNVENYFDVVNDSATIDEEFLPDGARRWNFSRYKTKQMRIGKVLAAIGGWNAPQIVGLCEVESRKSLVDLIRYSGLKSFGYQFVHYDSPDARGVDVALLYRPRQFKLINSKPVHIHFPNAPEIRTRDLLLVTGNVPSGDTLHIIVCHLPSRLEGELESENRRIFVAQTIRNQVDSLIDTYKKPNIIIMGDFNDYPDNKSITQVLKAESPSATPQSNKLYNLALPLHRAGKGTYKHSGQWGMLDQFIVSGNLLNTENDFYTQQADANVFDEKFLLEKDAAGLGTKPFRTYNGFAYNNGYSDHLPLFVDFWMKSRNTENETESNDD